MKAPLGYSSPLEMTSLISWCKSLVEPGSYQTLLKSSAMTLAKLDPVNIILSPSVGLTSVSNSRSTKAPHLQQHLMLRTPYIRGDIESAILKALIPELTLYTAGEN